MLVYSLKTMHFVKENRKRIQSTIGIALKAFPIVTFELDKISCKFTVDFPQ